MSVAVARRPPRAVPRWVRSAPAPKDFDRPLFLRVFTGCSSSSCSHHRARSAVLVQFTRSLQDSRASACACMSSSSEESLRDSLIASIEIALATMLIATVAARCWLTGSCARDRAGQPGQRDDAVPLVTPEIVAGGSALLLFTQVAWSSRSRRSSSPTSPSRLLC